MDSLPFPNCEYFSTIVYASSVKIVCCSHQKIFPPVKYDKSGKRDFYCTRVLNMSPTIFLLSFKKTKPRCRAT